MERLEQLASFGANWWANQLRNFYGDKYNVGEPGITNLTMCLGKMVEDANHSKPGYDEKVEKFEELLKKAIEDE